MIKSLRLRNWKCHLDSEFEFCEGTNALVGVMGAGKTSVLEAICFALFGTFPALQQRKVKLEDIIMKKPVRKDYAEVELSFVNNGSFYTVKRRIERGRATQAELRINGKLVEAQPQRVTEFVEDVLKIDFDLFARAIYSEQNKIESFLTLPRGERKKRIDEILKLDRFEAARASVVTLSNRVKSCYEEFSRLALQLARETNKEEISSLESEIREIEEKMKNAREALEELERIYVEKNTKLKIMDEIKRKIETLEKRRSMLIGSISALEKALEKEVPDEKLLRSAISRLRANLEELREKKLAIEKEIFSLRKNVERASVELREIENAERKIHELEEREKILDAHAKELKVIEKEIEEKKGELEKKTQEYYEANTKVKELEKAVKELEKEIGKCPICDSELPESKRLALKERKMREIQELKGTIISLRKEISLLQKEIEEFEKRKKSAEMRKIELLQVKREVEELKKKISLKHELKSRLEKIQSELEGFEREIEQIREREKEIEIKLREKNLELEKVMEHIRKKKELEQKRAELESVEKELEDSKKLFSAEKYEVLLEELREIYAKKKSTETELVSFERLVEEKRKRLEELKRNLELAEKYASESKKMERILKELEKFKIALQKTQEELRKYFISAVNEAMQSIWEELYPYGDFPAIRLHVTQEDYILQLQDLTGAWVSVEHVSGGERTLAALTLRIALALILAPQLRWLILDEPTHNLDIRAREELARILRDRICEFVDQVFLITHDPVLEGAVSGVLYRIEREKEKNTPAKVIRME